MITWKEGAGIDFYFRKLLFDPWISFRAEESQKKQDYTRMIKPIGIHSYVSNAIPPVCQSSRPMVSHEPFVAPVDTIYSQR